MSQLSYSFPLRILESLPHVVNPGPNVLDSALVEPPLVMLPPLNLIIPREKSVFNWLLERKENGSIGNCCELDYVTVTTHLPLHHVAGQQASTWIVMHIRIEGEGKVSEWAKLELGMGVWLFDEGLSKKNYGFEKVCIFGIIGKPYGWEPGYHVYWLEPHLFTIMQHPIPVSIPATLIAIPNYLLPKWHCFNHIHKCTLGQRLVAGILCLQPPL